jgi:hypothetical protein
MSARKRLMAFSFNRWMDNRAGLALEADEQDEMERPLHSSRGAFPIGILESGFRGNDDEQSSMCSGLANKGNNLYNIKSLRFRHVHPRPRVCFFSEKIL